MGNEKRVDKEGSGVDNGDSTEDGMKGERMRTLVIKSSEWLRGEGIDSGLLYRAEDSKACCLGLDALSCGIDSLSLVGKANPAKVNDPPLDYRRSWLSTSDLCGCSDWTYEAMEINDDDSITDDERIACLRPIFESVGVEIDWRPDE